MWLILPVLSIYSILSNPIIQGSAVSLLSSTKIANLWEGMQPATCMPDACFCEPVVSGLIRQPINTWSNLAFILVGFWAVVLGVMELSKAPINYPPKNLMSSHWIYPLTYGTTAVLVGVGSMFYHSSLIFYAQVLDILGMYLLASFMALYNLSRILKFNKRTFFSLYLGVNLALGYISSVYPVTRRPIFIAILVIILASELHARLKVPSGMNIKILAWAFISLGIGCSAWILDIKKAICLPDSWLQLHSLWHIGMAGAIGFIFLYYRSEKPSSRINITPVEPSTFTR